MKYNLSLIIWYNYKKPKGVIHMKNDYLEIALNELTFIFRTEETELRKQYDYDLSVAGLWEIVGKNLKEEEIQNIKEKAKERYLEKYPTVDDYIEKNRKVKTLEDAYFVVKRAKEIYNQTNYRSE